MSTRMLWMVAVCAFACAPKNDSASKTADTATPVVAAAPAVVNVTAKDFSFDAPDSIAAGLTTVRLTNAGTTIHHLQIVQLSDGKTFADLQAGLKSMKPTDPIPPWVHFIGGPNVVGPGATVEATQQLDAGTYGLICLVDTPDHIPHFAKGMMHPLTVTASTAAAAAVPASDVSVTLSDYAFAFTPALSAGKHTLKIGNSASQAHELVMFKLDSGKTLDDFMKWGATYKGKPPAQPVAGVTGMAPGLTSYLPVDLTPGDYVLICFFPDSKDGKPHAEHGMVQVLKIS